MANHGRIFVLSVVLALTVPGAAFASPAQQSSVNPQQPAAETQSNPNSASASSSNQAGTPVLPDSPGVLYSKSLIQDQTPPSGQQTAPGNLQNAAREPAGTAAARTVNPSGVAASEPAGAAIAPAKQRRMRTLLISVGAVLGAGAALGAVAALSAGSPSRPPGAH